MRVAISLDKTTTSDPLSESGMSRNFWGRIKGAKYRFTLQDGTWDFS